MSEETDLRKKVRAALKQYPGFADGRTRPRLTDDSQRNHNPKWVKPKREKCAADACREIAAKLGCSPGYVAAVIQIEKNEKIGRELNKHRFEPLPLTKELDAALACRVVADFPGWVFVFARLNAVVNSYLQTAHILGATMPATWLDNMLELIRNAQNGVERDENLRKFWPNGRPEGSGEFTKLLEAEHVDIDHNPA